MAQTNHNGNGADHKQVSVRDLLTDKQVARVIAIMKKEKDSTKRVAKVRKYLEQFHADLVIKGVVPSYLAYYFEWLLQQGKLE